MFENKDRDGCGIADAGGSCEDVVGVRGRGDEDVQCVVMARSHPFQRR